MKFEFENKVKEWIEINRIKWILFLGILGVSLGIAEIYLLDVGLYTITGLIMCFTYGSVLMICEVFMGGSGIE